jgi:predicted MFS family arabinose efflux permease
MTGIVAAGLGAGTLIGAPIANGLISTYDWRLSYIIMGCSALLLIILLAQFLKREPAHNSQADHDQTEAEERLQSRIKSFSIREAILTRQFWILFAMAFCFGFCLLAVLVHIAPYATDLGISATSAASVLATIGGASIIGKIGLGNVGDRIGNKRAYIVGCVLMLISFLWLLYAMEAWKLYLFAAAFGLAYGDCDVQQSPLAARFFGMTSHGLIFGAINSGFTIGAAIGPVVTGYLFDLTGNYQSAYLVCAAITMVGLIVTISLKPFDGNTRTV